MITDNERDITELFDGEHQQILLDEKTIVDGIESLKDNPEHFVLQKVQTTSCTRLMSSSVSAEEMNNFNRNTYLATLSETHREYLLEWEPKFEATKNETRKVDFCKNNGIPTELMYQMLMIEIGSSYDDFIKLFGANDNFGEFILN